MREIKNLFNKVIEEEYYKPIFVKESFNGYYKYYESRGDKRKELSVGQYFNMITPYSYTGLLEEYGKFKYVYILILFLLEILEKLILFMRGVIT